jgi:hypothetical protein
MTLEPHDRHLIEQLVGAVHTARGGRGLPGGQMVALSNGLQVTIALEAGAHSGEGGPGETRLWLGVSGPDRFPTVSEVQTLIALVFSASQQGAANPLAISTAAHAPYLVLCSSRLSRAA